MLVLYFVLCLRLYFRFICVCISVEKNQGETVCTSVVEVLAVSAGSHRGTAGERGGVSPVEILFWFLAKVFHKKLTVIFLKKKFIKSSGICR